jgi:hypothetical protein
VEPELHNKIHGRITVQKVALELFYSSEFHKLAWGHHPEKRESGMSIASRYASAKCRPRPYRWRWPARPPRVVATAKEDGLELIEHPLDHSSRDPAGRDLAEPARSRAYVAHLDEATAAFRAALEAHG